MINLFRLLVILMLIAGCTRHKKTCIADGTMIAMPEYYRKVIGYDSIQLVYGGRAKYNYANHDYDVTWDSLYAHFCYPNNRESEKIKRDTVFISDSVFIIPNIGSQ